MKVHFEYSKEKDVWCLLMYGKSSQYSENQTQQYQQLITQYGNTPSHEQVEMFIDAYLSEKNVSREKYISLYQKEWDSVSELYHRRAEEVFGAILPDDVTAFITINDRCPYSIQHNNFFITFPKYGYVARKIIMHELWHFYTWYSFGEDQKKLLGDKKYENLKEALTVLLNIVYADLFPELEGVIDIGYPQHREIREDILEFWKHNQDMKALWKHISVM